MHSRRWIAGYLALALCVSLFLSACGAAAPEAETPAPSDAETAAEELPAQDMPEASEQPEPAKTGVVLSELMASNHSCLADEDGAFYDWIELWNTGKTTEDLSGCWLSDDPREWNKWQIPSLKLAPGKGAVIFCAGKEAGGRELFADFSLSADGETILLSTPDGQLLWERSYPALETDQSACWKGEELSLTRLATPGYINSERGYEAFCRARDRHGALVINEAVLYNDVYGYHNGDFYDWVELRNASDQPIQLSDYYLSDDRNDRTKFRLPARTLAPGELFMVFCGETTGPTSNCHAPFKLDAQGESLYLTGPDGELSDYVGIYGLIRDASIGRSSGSAGFVLFEKRSPGKQNKEGFRFVSGPPTADLAQGIYENEEGLDITLSGPGPVYYTLNGSVPTEKSTLAEGPIHLDKTAVIRAACLEKGKFPSEIMSYSYILNEGHTLPVVSLVSTPSDFKIAINGMDTLAHPANITLFDGDKGFSRDCSIKLHGASSRNVWVKKSMKLIFKGRNGGDLDYDLFGNGIESFHSILLRGGFTTYMHLIRDPLAAIVANRVCDTDPFALDSRYCILYVNGKYWGLYCIREAYSEEYAAAHTGSDPDEVQIIKGIVNPEENQELAGVLNFIVGSDMSDPEAYAHASGILDMQSLAQWFCLQCYFSNRDGMGNIRYVKGNVPDGRWRTMLFDFDISMETPAAYLTTLLNGELQISQTIISLRDSEEFCRLVLDTAASLYRNGLNAETVLAIFDDMTGQVATEAPRDVKYWEAAPSGAYDHFLSVQRIRLGQQREDTWIACIQTYCGADEAEMKAAFPDYYQ
ncbi:MAG: lamin tail domain-containing protein [Clostridia bacterium]